MGRWEPDAAGRLREAAMELFVERGYEQTTVADIADRAGVTARTFFRHFTDKREVLFAGSSELLDAMVRGLIESPASASPMECVAAALQASAEVLGSRRDFARERHAVVAANAELLERELIKLASLSQALADALRRRGVPAASASLAAEAGIAVFRIGFERWVTDTRQRSLATVLRTTLAELTTLTTAATRTPTP